jgi:hypothetical protein
MSTRDTDAVEFPAGENSDTNRSGEEPAGEGHTVGYRKPPKASQFKPGQSGNPRGRPKGRMSCIDLAELYLSGLLRKVGVQENGKAFSITAAEVMVRKHIVMGMNNLAAAKMVFGYAAQAMKNPERAAKEVPTAVKVVLESIEYDQLLALRNATVEAIDPATTKTSPRSDATVKYEEKKLPLADRVQLPLAQRKPPKTSE